ncbi:MAG: hypothetical protein ACRDGQ_14985 [Candidatus Limnocylindrales bacterium]
MRRTNRPNATSNVREAAGIRSICSPQATLAAGRPLPTPLAERLEGHLATFATHLREGLLAASTVAVG